MSVSGFSRCANASSPRSFLATASLLALVTLIATPCWSWADESVSLRFNRDVRPILSDKCFQCHGPDEHNRAAELRLDEQEGVEYAFAGGLEDSEGWRRLTAEGDERMPPAESHKKITSDELQILRTWVAGGAPWEGHWAFVPPARPEPPRPTSHSDWVRNPIDAFVLARLHRAQLAPQTEAERELLLRRVTLDLTGVPPTLNEIDSFLADPRPDAYERAVDRLLQSKRFGERMAAAWMDIARYGDSSVFHADGPRDMWPWRDWVIQAYNQGKPFDDFTVEQLAGDLLPNATREQQIATGFNRNNATTDEGGAIAEEYRVEYVVDRVKTTSMTWLGLTLECAQCHDHKYDPISQEDYYRFFAFFNQASDPGMQTRRGNQTPVVDVPNYTAQRELKEAKQLRDQIEQQRRKRVAETQTAFTTWLTEAEKNTPKTPVPTDAVVHYAFDEGKGNTAASALDAKRKATFKGKPAWGAGHAGKAVEIRGGNVLDLGADGDFERTDAFSYGAWLKPKGAGGGAPLARMDNTAAFRGYDINLSGGFVEVHIIHRWPDNAIKVRTKKKLKPDQWQHVFVVYDGSSKAAGVSIFVNGEAWEWDIQQDGLSESIRTQKPLHVGRRFSSEQYEGAVDEVRIYSRAITPEEVAAIAGADPIRDLLALPADKRTEAQLATLREHYLRNHDEPYRKLDDRLNELQRRVADLEKPISTVMVMRDLPKPRMTFVLNRGSYDAPKKDNPVEPGVLSALPDLPPKAPRNRLGLAKWIVRPDHPLTARVAVNRYWYMMFGRGLVESVEDFGSQGQWPSHPALLDWMAVEFVESGWDVKHMIRLIVTSATYRQSSRASQELIERDPNNRLFARGPRFRLQAEFIRNNALAASGLLVDKTGGPSVKPYQPPGLWNEVSLSGNVRFVQDKGEKIYRRGMYTYWKRSAPAPFLTLFDAPSREKCTIRRSRTNTPLQALVVLNDPQYVEAARELAARVIDSEADLAKRITQAYRLAAGVRPSQRTLQQLIEAYQDELQAFQQSPESAEKFLSIGDLPRTSDAPAPEHAAMTIVCSIILNLDATLSRG